MKGMPNDAEMAIRIAVDGEGISAIASGMVLSTAVAAITRPVLLTVMDVVIS